MKYHIKERSFIAKIAAWKLSSRKVAIVIGKTIHLHNTTTQEFTESKYWLRHELKHVEQFHEHGFIRFIFLYLWESIKNGYNNNKYEIEARNAEADDGIVSRIENV